MAGRSQNLSPDDEWAKQRVRPVVALPRSGAPTPVLIVLAAILAIGLFLFLEARRQAGQEPLEAQSTFRLPAPPPPLVVPPAPPTYVPEPEVDELPAFEPPAAVVVPAAPPVVSPILMPQPPAAQSSPAQMAERSGPIASGLIVDFTRGSGAAVNGDAAADASAVASDDDAVRATLIRNRQSIIPQGTIIAAVLETPLNSDRPGPVRALVSSDARSFDGSRVLIPRGSRLIGEFQTDSNRSQRRVLVTWTRLIRPDGIAIRIGSPAADALGGIGVAGRVNTHFFERFASAVLQSALTVGVNVASQSAASEGSIYVGLPGQVGEIGKDLVPNKDRQPTVKVKEGAEIGIFVARDLDFGGTPPVR